MKPENKQRVNISLSPETRRAIKESGLNVSGICEDHLLRILAGKNKEMVFLAMKDQINQHERAIEIIKARAKEHLGVSYEEYLSEYYRGYEERERQEKMNSQLKTAKGQEYLDDLLAKSNGRKGDKLLNWIKERKDSLKANGLSVDDAIQYFKDKEVLA